MSLLAVAAGAAVMAGAALQSSIGFGFALVSAPLLFAATSPPEAVGLLIVLGLEIGLLTLLTERRRPRAVWADVLPVVAFALPGALVGVAVLRALDDVALQLLVTAGVLAALVLNLRANRATRRAPAARPVAWWARPLTGLTSGALNTSTSTGGPPVVLLLMARGLRPEVIRDTLTTSFVGFAAVSTAALALTATYEAVPDAGWLAALLPLTAAGQFAGRPLFSRLVAASSYDRVLAGVLLVTVAVGLIGVAV